MRILWDVRLYPPKTNRGAEWYAHELNRHLISSGDDVMVMIPKATEYTFDGVKVISTDLKHYQWADVIFTHLEQTDKAIVNSNRFRKPLVFIAHNTFDYPLVRHTHNVNVILNSEAAVDICGYDAIGRNRLVLPPPVDIDYYCVNNANAEAITLINLTDNKGAKLFYQLAEMMPDNKFIGVIGSYNKQHIQHLPNVEIVANTPDIRTIYERTKILLMPSKYESWGRTATEAMSSGIPVICHPTIGLKGNFGTCGMEGGP